MKSNLVKSIAAVLAMVAGVGAADAAITTGEFGAPGELFLTVWDPTVGNEASFNIGLNLTTETFNGNASYSYSNIFADPVFTQYFGPGSTGGTNLNNQAAWQWNVVASKDLADESQVLFTQQGLVNPTLINAASDNAATATTNYMRTFGSADSVGTDNRLSLNYAGPDEWGSDFKGAVQLIDNATGIGSSLNFYKMSNTGSFEATELANVTKQAYTWLLSADGTLTYGPSQTVVPVPAAIWLLGSGLLGLAGIGRRRAAVAA